MEIEELARVFSTWKGHCYIYKGSLDVGEDPFRQINRKVYTALGTRDFICRMVDIKGTVYVYSEDHHIDSSDFQYLGEINGANNTQGAG